MFMLKITNHIFLIANNNNLIMNDSRININLFIIKFLKQKISFNLKQVDNKTMKTFYQLVAF